MKKLALLGAARPRYEDKVKDVLNNPKCDKHCWTGWSYKINPSKLKILDKQFNRDGRFYIYYHDIKNPTEAKYGKGTGFVEYRLKVEKYKYSEEFVTSPEPECTSSIDRDKPHRLYACVFKEPEGIERKKYYEFIDFDTNGTLSVTGQWSEVNMGRNRKINLVVPLLQGLDGWDARYTVPCKTVYSETRKGE